MFKQEARPLVSYVGGLDRVLLLRGMKLLLACLSACNADVRAIAEGE